MKYEYTTVTEKIEIDVDDKWITILKEMDRLEFNNNQTETRRHASLEAFNLDDALFPSDEDIAADFEMKEQNTALYSAIEKLKPKQQKLIEAVYFEGISISDYAKKAGVSQQAISQQLYTIRTNLKKF